MEPILQAQSECLHAKSPKRAGGRLRIIPYCFVENVISEVISGDGRIGDAAGYSRVATGIRVSVRKYPESMKPPPGSTAAEYDVDLGPVDYLSSTPLIVKANIVVSACGAIQSPALLLRSNMTNPKIGKHLALHTVSVLAGYFPDVTVDASNGVAMGVVVNDPPIEADGPGESGWRLAVETPPMNPALFGSLLPWSGSSLAMKGHMLLFNHVASFLCLSRDRSQEKNRVEISSEGEPVIHYVVAEADKPMMRKGLQSQFEMMRAAGAKIILPMHESFRFFVSSPNDEKAAKIFIDDLLSDCLTPSKSVIFSAHQMSTCRMSSTPAVGVVRPSGETWECRNLFVCDASVFPTSLGINPMITVAAFAHYIADFVIKRHQADGLPGTDVKGTISYQK
jgi:choline dehydrogenase-like flavoprotein